MRESSSGGSQRLQSGRGALPNIAPPSRRWLLPSNVLASIARKYRSRAGTVVGAAHGGDDFRENPARGGAEPQSVRGSARVRVPRREPALARSSARDSEG